MGRVVVIDDQRLGDDVFNAHARIERGVRILENNLHAPPQLAQLSCRDGEEVVAIERNCARVGFDEAQQQASDGAFSGAGFADDAERLAAFDVEGDIVDNTAWLSTATHGIGLDEMVDFNKGHDEGAAARIALPANAGSQRHKSEAGAGKLIRRSLHVNVATLSEYDEAPIGI